MGDGSSSGHKEQPSLLSSVFPVAETSLPFLSFSGPDGPSFPASCCASLSALQLSCEHVYLLQHPVVQSPAILAFTVSFLLALLLLRLPRKDLIPFGPFKSAKGANLFLEDSSLSGSDCPPFSPKCAVSHGRSPTDLEIAPRSWRELAPPSSWTNLPRIIKEFQSPPAAHCSIGLQSPPPQIPFVLIAPQFL